MQVTMNYGKHGLPLDLPDSWEIDVIRKTCMPVLESPEQAVKAALSNPIACRTLAEEACGGTAACIAICDITRPVPNGLVLPAIIGDLVAAGMSPDNITILIATGLHRPNEGAEMAEVVGSQSVLDRIRVVNHFAEDDCSHADLGVTSRGTPVKIDRRFVEADLRIVVGLVEPHFMAGYSGGRKLIAPGISHRDTITALHSARLLEHPRATNCVLADNPVHAEQLEIAAMVGRVLAVNLVIDEDRRVSLVNYGEVIASHLRAVNDLASCARVPVKRAYSAVLTSSAGYPLDKTYYQTVKAMVAAIDILEPGGDLFVVSECSEGIGSGQFADSQRDLIESGVDRFVEKILSCPRARIDEWETHMLIRALRRGSVHLYSTGLTGPQSSLTAVNSLPDVPSLLNAVNRSLAKSPSPRLAVIPEGPYVVPFVA